MNRSDETKGELHQVLVVSYETAMSALFALPRYTTLNRVKAEFLRAMGANIGTRVVFYPGVWIVPAKNLTIGDDVDLARDVIITTGGGVSIGARTLVGYRTQILSSNHAVPGRTERIFDAGHESKAISIASDVWIGANCLVLAGVSIGEGAVVAGGSVVSRSVPSFTMVAGVPARVIKERS